MFGKIIKSVLLTKDGRAAYDKVQKSKAAKAKAPAARKAAPSSPDLRNDANATELDEATIREAINRAHQELVLHEQPDGTPKATDAHAETIRSAMTVYRNKQKVLKDLDPEAMAKLRLMAAHMLRPVIRR